MGQRVLVVVAALALVTMFAARAVALEVSGGVVAGGIFAGSKPRFAVSPNAGVSWRAGNGFLVAGHDVLSVIVATDAAGVGFYNQTSAAAGYGWETGSFSVGPSLSVYSMPVCGVSLCGRVTGIAPGAMAQVSVLLAAPFGLSLSTSVDFAGEASGFYSAGPTVRVSAGPVLQWRSK